MNRRTFIRSTVAVPAAVGASASLVAASCSRPNDTLHCDGDELEAYSGPFHFEQAAFLLNRTTFGVTDEQVSSMAKAGLGKTLDTLFEKRPMPAPPLNFEYPDDKHVPIGKTWVDAPYVEGKEMEFILYRKKSLCAWIFNVMLEEQVSIREQLTLFWHNHFGISDIGEHKFEYVHNCLLRQHAWGNFRELVKQVAVDPCMLEFLNGNLNRKGAPNENFARELLELFTVGKGALKGAGDYTTFTETDVREMAKVLTGWSYNGWFNFDGADNAQNAVVASFHRDKHDNSFKRLSPAFGSALIPPLFSREYTYLIDKLFEREAAALFICRKLYRWFVHYRIDEATEQQVICPMARLLMENDYEIEPVLRQLLGSRHFFSRIGQAPKIRNPIEFVLGPLKRFSVRLPDELAARYTCCSGLFESAAAMGMEYFFPPSVAGWKAYYQEPLYYRIWISSSTLMRRKSYVDKITGDGLQPDGAKVRVEAVPLLQSLGWPGSAEAVTSSLLRTFYLQPVNEDKRVKLKSILLDGMAEERWNALYGSSARHELSPELATGLHKALRYVLNSVEYHII